MELQVRKPNPHHNHWGLVLLFEKDEDCTDVVAKAMSLGNAFNVFHQGGYHLWHEHCPKHHYLEFWGLPGGEEHRAEVESMIIQLKEA